MERLILIATDGAEKNNNNAHHIDNSITPDSCLRILQGRQLSPDRRQ